MSETHRTDRPNIVYILADQLRYQSCGYAGDGVAHTPSLDGLAVSGISFRQAVSSMPVCSAYRASLFTGKYTSSTGMVINELRMNTAHTCLAHCLTRSGYDTGYIGKWHMYANELGNHYDPKNSFVPPGPDRLGFDGHWAGYNFHHVYYDVYYHTDSPQKTPYPAGAYEPDAQTDMAAKFIREHAGAKQPFALFLSYGTPHDPWTDENVPGEYRALFDDVRFPDPPNYRAANGPRADTWGRLSPVEREHLPGWRRNYYSMAANLDHNVGRVLDAIEHAGIADDTIVVFTSDHGEMFGAHGRRAKNIFYEEAIRVPFLLRWPGHVPAGAESDACLGTVDIMPTLLSLAGVDIPCEVEGTDLAHVALGLPGAEPEFAFLMNTGACAAWENGYEWRALRNKRYTFAVYRGCADKGLPRQELLFDNLADPYQGNDLAADTRHSGSLARFRDALEDRMTSLNDTFPESTWYRDNWIEDRIIKRTASLP